MSNNNTTGYGTEVAACVTMQPNGEHRVGGGVLDYGSQIPRDQRQSIPRWREQLHLLCGFYEDGARGIMGAALCSHPRQSSGRRTALRRYSPSRSSSERRISQRTSTCSRPLPRFRSSLQRVFSISLTLTATAGCRLRP